MFVSCGRVQPPAKRMAGRCGLGETRSSVYPVYRYEFFSILAGHFPDPERNALPVIQLSRFKY